MYNAGLPDDATVFMERSGGLISILGMVGNGVGGCGCVCKSKRVYIHMYKRYDVCFFYICLYKMIYYMNGKLKCGKRGDFFR